MLRKSLAYVRSACMCLRFDFWEVYIAIKTSQASSHWCMSVMATVAGLTNLKLGFLDPVTLIVYELSESGTELRSGRSTLISMNLFCNIFFLTLSEIFSPISMPKEDKGRCVWDSLPEAESESDSDHSLRDDREEVEDDEGDDDLERRLPCLLRDLVRRLRDCLSCLRTGGGLLGAGGGIGAASSSEDEEDDDGDRGRRLRQRSRFVRLWECPFFLLRDWRSSFRADLWLVAIAAAGSEAGCGSWTATATPAGARFAICAVEDVDGVGSGAGVNDVEGTRGEAVDELWRGGAGAGDTVAVSAGVGGRAWGRFFSIDSRACMRATRAWLSPLCWFNRSCSVLLASDSVVLAL